MKQGKIAVFVITVLFLVAVTGCGKPPAPAPPQQPPAQPPEQRQDDPAPPPSTPPADETPYTDGVYEGSGEGYAGSITIEVTINGGAITNIEIVMSTETESIGGAAYGELIGQALVAQNAEIDLVSGATVTAQGFIEALEDALSKAVN